MLIRIEEPSGVQNAITSVPLNFEGSEETALVTHIALNFVAQSEGLYWIDVLFGQDERLLTRIPLRVVYVPQKLASA